MATDNVLPFERRSPPPPPRDFDAAAALARCRAMLDALGSYGLADEVAEACVTLLLINLHDLLQAARAAGRALGLADHVDPIGGIADITGLVARCRNAACHVWGQRGMKTPGGANALRFARVAGYLPRAFTIDGHACGCDYHDDVAIYYGPHRLYLKRHAARAVEELAPLFA